MITLGSPLPIYGKVKFGNLGFSIKEHENFEVLTMAQGYLHMKIKTGFSKKAVDHFQSNFVCKLFYTRKIKLNGIMLAT